MISADWQPRPIATEAEYRVAFGILQKMAGRRDMDAGEENYFDAVTAFVEAYDDAHAPPRGPDARTPTERLRALLEEAGLGVNDLAKIVGNRPLAHHLIVGRREPSKEVCRKLGAHFKMNPGYFL